MPVSPKVYDDSVFTKDTTTKKPEKGYDDSIFTGEPVKKKEAGGQESKPYPRSAFQLQSPIAEIPETQTRLTDDEVYNLVQERKQLKYATSPDGKEYKAFYSYGDTEQARKDQSQLAENTQKFKNAGLDADEIEGIYGDIPMLKTFGVSEAITLKRDNPESFERRRAAIKYRSELYNAVKNEFGEAAAKTYINDLADKQISYDYDQTRENTRNVIGEIYARFDDGDKQKKLINEVIKDRMYTYGLNLPGTQESIANDPRLGAYTEDQVLGLQFLEDVDPQAASSFNRLLSLTPEEIAKQSKNTSFKLGLQLKQKELEDIGLNIQQRAVEEKMTDFVNKNKETPLSPEEQTKYQELFARRQEILQKRDAQNANYPLAVATDADRLMQDYLGAKHGTLSKTLLGIGENADDLINFATTKTVLNLTKDGRIDDLEKFGSKQLGQLSQYETKEEELFGRAFVPVFSGELKTKLDGIRDDKSLSQEQKEDAVRGAIFEDNFKNISYVSNDKAGKFNFTGKAVLNSVSNVASEIIPQIVASYVTAGASNASKLQQLSSLFGNTFAMAYNDYYTDAINRNIAKPNDYAILHTTIEAATELFGNNIEMAKRAFAGTTAGKILGETTETQLQAIAKAGSGKFRNFADALGKTAKISEKNARVEGFEELAGAIGGNAVDKLAFNQDVALTDDSLKDFVTTYVGMIPLGIFGLPFQYKNVNQLQKRAFYEASSNPAKYFEKLDQQVEDGTMNINDAFQIKQRITDGYEALKELNVAKSDGNLMTDNEKTDYLFNKVVQKDIEKHKTEATEEQQEQLKGINNEVSAANEVLSTPIQRQKAVEELHTKKAADLQEIDDKIAGLDTKSENYTTTKTELEKKREDVVADYDIRLKEERESNPKVAAPVAEESRDQLLQKAQDAATSEMNPDYAAVFTKNVEVGLKEAAQQLNATEGEAKTARELYGPTISDIALKLFPDERPPEMSSEMEASLLEDDDSEVDFLTQNIETTVKNTYETVSPILQRINNADYINENELNAAANSLYDVLDKIEKSGYSKEAKESSANLVEPLISKIEGYEFRTKTESSTITEAKTASVPRKTEREVKPALEQSIGSRATIQFPDGGTTKGTLNLRGGRYVLDVPKGEQVVIGEKAITDRDLQLPSEEEMENPIEFDENGAVKAVTFKTRSGNFITIEDPEKALDIAIRLRADSIGEVPQELFDTVYEEIKKEIQREVLVTEEKPIESQKDKPKKSESKKTETKKKEPPKEQPQKEKSTEQKGDSEKSGTAKEPPPSKPPLIKEENDNDDEYRNKAIVGRMMKSKKVSETSKEQLKESGLKYKVRHQEEARQIANEIIDEYGITDALVMAEAGKFHGDVNSMIFAVSLDRIFQEEQEATDAEDKQAAAERWADIALRYQDAAESGGRFISAINDFYKKSPAGLVIKTEKEFKRRQDEYFEGREKPTKEAWEEFIGTVEGKELLETEIEKRKPKLFTEETKKKIKGFFNKFRINPKDQAGVYLVPPQILNAAIDIIEQAVLAGVSIGSAIEKGIDHINANHKEAWKIKEFRKDVRDGFKAQKVKKNLSDNDKTRILNKWRKKLGGLNEEQRQKLLNKAFLELIDNGALNYDDFKQLYAEVIGLPQMTPELATKLTDLAKKINEPDNLKEKILKDKKTDDIKAYNKAVNEAEKAGTELNELIGKQKNWFNTFLTVMRLNTLGTVTLIGNITANLATLPIRFATKITGTGLDYLVSGVQFTADKLFGTKYYKKVGGNIPKIQYGYARGFLLGSKLAIKQFFTGLTSRDYFQREIQQNIRPLTSAKKLIRNMTGKERLTLNEKINAFIEANPLMGWSAETIARALNVGDKGFRFGAEFAEAERLAQQKNLKGIDKEIFVLFPDEESEKKIKEAGEKAVFQQKNIVQKAIDMASAGITNQLKERGWDSKFLHGIGKLIGYTTQPFLNTPLNVFSEFINYAFPPLPLYLAAKAMVNKDSNKATYHLAQAVVGLSVGYAAGQLVAAGLVTGAGDDYEQKERAGIVAYQRQGQLNVSGLKRWLAGSAAENKDDDVWVDLKYYGFMGMLLLTKAAQHKEKTKAQIEEETLLQDIVGQFLPGVKVGLTEGVFSGTSSLINAYSMGGGYLDNYLLGMMNTFTNAFDPQWLRQFSMAGNEYFRDTKGMTLPESAKNQLKQRLFMGHDLPAKVNIWGDKVESVPNQHNPYLYYLFGINKSQIFDNDRFGFVLYDYYLQTKDYNIFPPAVRREVNGKPLTPEQYEQFSILVGSHRKQLLSAVVEGGVFEDLKAAGHEEMIKYLTEIYTEGRQYAIDEFVSIYPDFEKEE
jgi:hypothetical protein